MEASNYPGHQVFIAARICDNPFETQSLFYNSLTVKTSGQRHEVYIGKQALTDTVRRFQRFPFHHNKQAPGEAGSRACCIFHK